MKGGPAMNNTVITIPTINVPTFIDGICENINTYGHSDASILVIGAAQPTSSVPARTASIKAFIFSPISCSYPHI